MPPQIPIQNAQVSSVPIPIVKYAGFWVRATALLIDCLVLGVLQLIIVLSIGSGVPGNLVYVIVVWVYVLFMVTKYQATLGKMVVGLRIERTNGEKISLWRAFLREIIGKFFSLITLSIGYLMVAWTQQKQGLHDKIADTVVIEKNPSKSKTIWIAIAVITVFMIPVVGILSSVVLATLNSAGMKSLDALASLKLSTVVIQAEIYYETNGNKSYLGYCESPEALSYLAAASSAGSKDGNASSYVCNDSKDAWAASVPLLKTGYACADSKGDPTVVIASPLINGQTACDPSGQ